MKITYHGGAFARATSKRAVYYSKKLVTANGHPAGGDISEITFTVENLKEIEFTSKRQFKLGPEMYRGKEYIEHGKITLASHENSFEVVGLKSSGDPLHPFAVRTEDGVVLLSSDALEELLDAINELAKKIIINENKEKQFLQAAEILNLLQRPWEDFPDVFKKVQVFAQRYAFPVFILLEQLRCFDLLVYNKWIKGSASQNIGEEIIQTNLQRKSAKTTSPKQLDNSGPIPQFNALVRLVSSSCEWEESYAACRIYGALLAKVKEEARLQCNVTYNLRIQEDWDYEETLRNYILQVKENYNDSNCLGCFVYYLIINSKLPIPPKYERTPFNLGFEYAYEKVSQDIEPYAKSFFENMEVSRLEKELSQNESVPILTVEDFDLMNGQEFERAVANLFKSMGYQLSMTPVTGDQGIDIIAVRNGLRIGIQTKCYAGKVGNSAVQEVVAGKQYYGVHRCIVVTNSTFTNSAIELAKANHVILWDRGVLEEKLQTCDSSNTIGYASTT